MRVRPSVAVLASSSSKTAYRGPTVRYSVTLANTNKKDKTMGAVTAFDKAGLVVPLPAGTTYVKGSVTRAPPRRGHQA